MFRIEVDEKIEGDFECLTRRRDERRGGRRLEYNGSVTPRLRGLSQPRILQA
jgi:hypothetical protein